MNSAPRTNPDRLRSYLEGVEFPAGKEEILLRAAANEFPDDIVGTFLGVPDREYVDQADLVRGVYEV